ncbi:sugar ABC transporter substrate-binding protein [Conexibacter woesei]|uniref:ABC-type sugar transport system periplasmic component-like protein n=1 Tax=Conexibacter woesei (strain DSM 14684 / CCUG 47730 / CIP 108061 / JCM 11494 / NBRC 100937 / ID131577) TaxID=469383 RepID=D3FEL8_CONWI|nr:sugar ABC transporter substrate-binding protein [Conexibacter woesei]ADB49692.1 ABC-type sugar transport system periplasmic component-like protein [Conexibacter woesei DSM 14684]
MSRPTLVTPALLISAALAFAACGSSDSSSKSGSKDTGIAAAEGTQPVAGRPMPVDNPDKQPVRIAIISAPPQIAEFFKAVTAGALRADDVLTAHGGSVDYVNVTDFTVGGINSAVRTAISQGYDAIAVSMLSSGNCAPLKEATAKGIKVASLAGNAECAESSGALFFHGEDSLKAWAGVGKTMVDATGGQECKVGIITGSFSVEAHEQRRNGFIDGLEGSNVSPVSKGVEGGVDPAKTQAATRDYVSANPDLCGIAVLVNDNGAAAAALTPEQAKKIKVISADLTTGIEKQIGNGKQYASFTQDPFGESYDTAIWLYNAVITGKGPEGGFFQPVEGVLVTKDNLEAAVEAQSNGER